MAHFLMSIRLSEKEAEAVAFHAKKAGLTAPAYVRALVVGITKEYDPGALMTPYSSELDEFEERRR